MVVGAGGKAVLSCRRQRIFRKVLARQEADFKPRSSAHRHIITFGSESSTAATEQQHDDDFKHHHPLLPGELRASFEEIIPACQWFGTGPNLLFAKNTMCQNKYKRRDLDRSTAQLTIFDWMAAVWANGQIYLFPWISEVRLWLPLMANWKTRWTDEDRLWSHAVWSIPITADQLLICPLDRGGGQLQQKHIRFSGGRLKCRKDASWGKSGKTVNGLNRKKSHQTDWRSVETKRSHFREDDRHRLLLLLFGNMCNLLRMNLRKYK